MQSDAITDKTTERLKKLTQVYGRCPS